jgi:hypothetical protein
MRTLYITVKCEVFGGDKLPLLAVEKSVQAAISESPDFVAAVFDEEKNRVGTVRVFTKATACVQG